MLNPKLIHIAAITALILSAAAMAQVYVTPGQPLSTDSSGTSGGTLGALATAGSSRYIITAGHISNDWKTGVPFYTLYGGRWVYIGRSDRVADPWGYNTDAARVALTTNVLFPQTPTLYFQSSECSRLTGPPYVVRGYARSSSYLFWQGAPVIFNGVGSTCIVLSVKVPPGRLWNPRLGTYVYAFLTEPRQQSGDSGGPASLSNGSYLRNTPVWIGGIHMGRFTYTDGNVYGWIVSIDYIFNLFLVQPYPNSWA